MDIIRLVWVDKLRKLIEEGHTYKEIVEMMLAYGEKEEVIITEKFEEDDNDR